MSRRLFDGAQEELGLLPFEGGGDGGAISVGESLGLTDTVTLSSPALTLSPSDAVGLTDSAATIIVQGIDLPSVDGAEEPDGPDVSLALVQRLPSIDGASTVIGPSIQNFDLSEATLEINMVSIDGLSEPDGPFIVLLVEPAPTPTPLPDPTPGPSPDETIPPYPGADTYEGAIPALPMMPLRARLLSSSMAPIVWLDSMISLQWQDPHNDDGVGTVTLPRNDPDIASIVPGTLIQCWYYGVPAFTFVVPQGIDIRTADPNGPANETVKVTGPGTGDLLRKAIILGPKGLDDPLVPQHRIFSFASPDYPSIGGFNPTSYVHGPQSELSHWAQEVEYTRILRGQVTNNQEDPTEEEPAEEQPGELIESIWEPAPWGWPASRVEWIWGQEDSQVVGRNYFYREVSIATETLVAICVTGDNHYTLYLDGTPILGENDTDATWREYKRIDMSLPPGTYTLAAVVDNIPWPPEHSNPAALLMAMLLIGEDGEPILDDSCFPRLVPGGWTNATWRSLAYPRTEPGWRTGEIVRQTMSEAVDRGALTGWIQPSPTTDSGGNAWAILPAFATPIGSTVRDVLDSMVDQGIIDWRVDPGQLRLRMFNQSPTGVSSGASHLITTDLATQEIVSLSWTPQNEPITRLFVKHGGGYLMVEDAAAQAQWGVHEGIVSIDASTRAEVTRRANVLLDGIKAPAWAGVAEIDPLPGNRPYDTYRPGDRITVPDKLGTPTEHRVMSITVSMDEDRRPAVSLELDERLLTRLRDEMNLIHKIGTGTMGNTKVREVLDTTEAVAK